MMYGKLIDGLFVPFTEKYIRANGRVYVNPKTDTLLNLGYKPLVTSERPEEKEGFYIADVYSETETEILLSFEYNQIITDDELNSEISEPSAQTNV